MVFVWGGWQYGALQGRQAWLGAHSNDFKHLYIGARLLAEGTSPYDREWMMRGARRVGADSVNPYVYLPFTAQVMRPLAALSFKSAARAWFVVNHVLLWAGILLLATAAPRGAGRGSARRAGEGGGADDGAAQSGGASIARRVPHPLLLALGAWLCFSSIATYRTLTAGQLNVVLFCCYALVWWLLARGRERGAGVVAAFAALFKLAPGLLLVYFALTGRRRATAAMIVAGAAFAVVGMAWSGPAVWWEFRTTLADMGFGRSTWGDTFTFYKDPYNQSLNSFFHHILASDARTTAWADLGAGWANALTMLGALAIAGAVFAVAWWRRADEGVGAPGARADGVRARALFAAFVLASLLIPSLYWDHYNLIALVALLLLLWAPGMERRPAFVVALVAVGWLWGVPWAFQLEAYPLGGGAFPPGRAWSWLPATAIDANRGVGLLLQSLKLWPSLALFAVCLAIAWRGDREPHDSAGATTS